MYHRWYYRSRVDGNKKLHGSIIATVISSRKHISGHAILRALSLFDRTDIVYILTKWLHQTVIIDNHYDTNSSRYKI